MFKSRLIKAAFGSTLILSVFLGACENTRDNTEQAEMDHTTHNETNTIQNNEVAEITRGVAVMKAAEGNNVSGTLTFTPEGNSMKVTGDLTGLQAGKHGFHIHQFGDCSAPDFTSAGGHFAPLGNQHGAPTANDTGRHVGDLGNLEVNSDGSVSVNITDNMLTFSGKNSILGRAVIIHEKEDDLTTQPTGDAGGRIACGVIGIAENGTEVK